MLPIISNIYAITGRLSKVAALVLTAQLAITPLDSFGQFGLPDGDGDGIADIFELYGFSDDGQTIDFPGLGANPYRKDIFIEADIMNGITLPAGAFQNVIASFANAPVTNPNGAIGINMYIDASGSVPFYQEIDFDSQFTSEGHRINPRIDVNGNGQIAICWQDDRDRNGYYQIFARLFDNNGVPLTGEITVNQVSDGQQTLPDIAQNENGDFVVVWQDDRDENGYYEIYGRVFDSTGAAITDDVKVNPVSDGQQLRPTVGMDDMGNWIAGWQDDRDGNDYYELFARQFDRNGVAQGNEVKVNPVSDGQQRNMEIATNGPGNSVIVWEDDRDGNGYYEIYARRLDANGAVNGAEVHVNVVSDGQQYSPTVALNDAGIFVAGWQDDRDGNGYYEIFARRFNSNGTANGGEIHVNQESDGQQKSPGIAINSAGNFTVCWEDDRDDNGYYQVYARTFNSNGSPRTGDRVMNTVSTDQQINAAVGMADDGDYAVVYQDDRDENNLWSVYFRIRNQNGASVSTDIAAHDYPRKFNNLKSNYFTQIRRYHFHYCIVANSRVGTGSSGIGNINGQNFIVSLGTTPGLTRLNGTFMHELGHNLGLEHGGNEGKNRKPNYLSVMNYRYQFWGADNDCDASSASPNPESLNYSLGRKFSLNENSLDERIGICNGELDVNWISSGQQIDADIDANDNGSFVACFEDDRDENGYYEIYARPYDTNGDPVKVEVHANPVSSGQQRDPAVGMADDGSFKVTWEDDRDENGYYEIYAQRFLPNGDRVGGEIKVNTESDGNQVNPDLAVASDGAFVIVWEDDRDNNGYYEIYGKSFSANGAPITGDIHINAVSDGQQLRPRVEMADDHRFVVTWEDDRDDNGYYEIFARRFNANGRAAGGETAVNPVSDGQQRNPDIGVASDGRFVVVWEDDRDGNGYFEIFARRFNNNGTGLGGEFRINNVSDGQQRYPRIVANDNFEFAVTWQDDNDDNGFYQIWTRPYRSDGTPRNNGSTVNPVSDGQQRLPDIGIDQNAGLFIVWQDDRDENDYYEIFAVRANANGTYRDRVAIDWDGDGSSNESDISFDINNDNGDMNTLKDYNDWQNINLDF